MITITTWEALRAHPHANSLLTDRLADFRDQPLSDLCKVLILEPGDTLVLLERGLGQKLHPPPWEYLQLQDGWYEFAIIESDDGHGVVVLIPNQPDVDPLLLELCRTHID